MLGCLQPWRARLRSSLQAQLSLLVALVVGSATLLMAVGAGAAFVVNSQRLEQQQTQTLASTLALALLTPLLQRDFAELSDLLAAAQQYKAIGFVQVQQDDGSVLAEFGQRRLDLLAPQPVEAPIVLGGRELGRISLQMRTSTLEDSAPWVLLTLALVLLLSLAASYALFRHFVRHHADRARQLRQAIEAFGRGESGVRSALEGSDELAQFAAAFERAAQEVEQHQAALSQARLEAEAANRAKSQFLARMSHEIRTPMNAVLGLTQLVRDMELPERPRQMLDLVLRSGRSLLSLLNDILDFSKIDAGRLELERIPFSIEQLLHELRELYSGRLAEKGIELRLDLAPELPTITIGDPLRLRQVLLNLVGNALKFTERGAIVVRVRPGSPHPQPEGLARYAFEVSDTGIGISEQVRAQLFQPFMQADSSVARRFGGTGLGLSICQRLVQLMGGSISVRSTLGSGSTFGFEISLGVGRADPAAPAHRPARGLQVPAVDEPEGARTLLSAPDAGPAAAPEAQSDCAAALQAVLQRLRPYLAEDELPPDGLIGELAALMPRQPRLQAPIMRLLQCIDDFDHPGALRLIDSLLSAPAHSSNCPPNE